MSDLRRRMSLLAKSSIAGIDKLLDEAAKYRKAAPGLLEARDALQFTLTANALADEHESDHSHYAEMSLLGALFRDAAHWSRVSGITDDDFALDCHRRIFRHMTKVASSDVVLVWESICASNEFEQVGGLSYLIELEQASPSAANIEAWAKLIHVKADKRRKLEKRYISRQTG